MPLEKILIVDDEEDIVKTTAMALMFEGYEVYTAASGEEALEVLDSVRPDLLIIDVLLPGQSGKQIASDIKNTPHGQNMPVILISALTQKSEEETISQVGADFFLKKPFDLDEMCKKIKELLEKRESGINGSGKRIDI